MFRSKWMTGVLAASVLLLTGGCANLGAVRDFASSSAKLTDYKGATERYTTSAERQLADLPPAAVFDAPRKDLVALKEETAAQKKTLLNLHAVSTGYMAALAGLAGEDVYSISKEIDQVSGAITAFEELKINEDHVKAYSNIVGKVADWLMSARQAADVKRMVKDNGVDMDKLLEAMQFATEAYGEVLDDENDLAIAVERYRGLQWADKMKEDANLTPARREVLASLLRKSTVNEKAERASAIKSQESAAAGLIEVRTGHAELLRNIDRLDAKDVQDLLKKAASDLKSIRNSLDDL